MAEQPFVSAVNQSVSIQDEIGVISEASISAASSGDNTLVAGSTGTVIKVWRLFLVCNAAVNLYFRNGTSGTAFTGVMDMTANGSIVFDYTGEPWFTCSSAANFVLNLSGAQQVSGRIYYTQT